MTSDYEPMLSVVNRVVSGEDNSMLLALFSHDEFKEALFAMNLSKALGPTGFNPRFYQHFWCLIGLDIMQYCTEWLNYCSLPYDLNETNIVLLPKNDSPSTMCDLNPISLCHVLYRVIAKVLANRLQQLFPKIISIEQSTFIKGCFIVDNILVAFELIHHMKTEYKAKLRDVALKIDILKAYDRVDWGYLQVISLKLEFDKRWVDLMMMCVNYVSYSVLVNNSKVSLIVLGRGLRQGCPLSPYLFFMCAEGLSSLIRRELECGTLHGVKICQVAPVAPRIIP